MADLRIMVSGSLACSSPEIENHLSIIAREGELSAVGSQLKAGNDVALSASRDLNLIFAANTSLLEGKNESKGGTVGVGIGVGSGGWGIRVSASVNLIKDKMHTPRWSRQASLSAKAAKAVKTTET